MFDPEELESKAMVRRAAKRAVAKAKQEEETRGTEVTRSRIRTLTRRYATEALRKADLLGPDEKWTGR